MRPESIMLVALALLIFYLIVPGKISIILGVVSAILVIGTLRHPERVLSQFDTTIDPYIDFYATMILVGIILIVPILKSWFYIFNRKK